MINPRVWLYLLTMIGFGLKPFGVAAQNSSVKYKRLQYRETDPGITVNQDEIEVLLEMENEDQLSFTLLHDAISGASPTGISDTDGVTGASSLAGRGQQFATFSDERTAFSAGYAPLLNRTTRLKTSLSYSEEDDYLSRGLSLGATFELNKKNTTLTPSYLRLEDRVMPSNGKTGGRKTTDKFSFEFSQVLNRSNLVRAGIYHSLIKGHLTDPYKLVRVGNAIVDESRPDSRNSTALMLGWRTQPFQHHAFDVDLRFYQDDWDVASAALRLKTLHSLGNWLLSFNWRYYKQEAASFWADNFSSGNTDPYRTSDQRLSRFISVTLGMTVTYKVSEAWWLEFSYARYLQSGSNINPSGLDNTDATVEALTASLAVQYRF